MSMKEFVQEIDKRGYAYKRVGDAIIVNMEPAGNTLSSSGTYLRMDLDTITSLIFQGKGALSLYFVKSIPPGVHFNHEGSVSFKYLESIPPGVEFNNRGGVWLGPLSGGDYFHRWEGNIEGVDSKRLLNLMIKQGVFER